MARGWESKSIEAQQEEAVQARRGSGRPPTAEEREEAGRRRTLELARSKVLADLTRATTAVHREMLQQAVADLDARLRNRGSG